MSYGLRCPACGSPHALVLLVWVECPADGCRLYSRQRWDELDLEDRWDVMLWSRDWET